MISRSEAARARERIDNLMAQLVAYENGDQHSITCPYCGGVNRPSTDFCCDMFGKASIAALERIRVEQAKEQVERIAEKHSRN